MHLWLKTAKEGSKLIYCYRITPQLYTYVLKRDVMIDIHYNVPYHWLKAVTCQPRVPYTVYLDLLSLFKVNRILIYIGLSNFGKQHQAHRPVNRSLVYRGFTVPSNVYPCILAEWNIFSVVHSNICIRVFRIFKDNEFEFFAKLKRSICSSSLFIKTLN